MKFGQLIECNMKNIFLKNPTQNVMEKLFPDPFMVATSIFHGSSGVSMVDFAQKSKVSRVLKIPISFPMQF